MKASLIKKSLLGLLTFISLTLMILPFVAVYDLGNEATLLAYAASVCLFLVFIPKVRYSLPLLLLGWFVVLYRIFPYGTSFSLDWLTRFGYDFLRAVREIIMGDVGYITELAAVTLIVNWVLFLAILPIIFRWFFFTYAMMLSYLLTVVIFNRFDLTWHITGILICGLASSLNAHMQIQHTRKLGDAGIVNVAPSDGCCCLFAKNSDQGAIGQSIDHDPHQFESNRLLSIYRRTWYPVRFPNWF